MVGFTFLLLLSGAFASEVTTELTLPTCNTSTFPADFKFGAASSAYQIEGAWNVDGKGPSFWDWLFNSNLTSDNGGDVADDSYHRYLDDVAALKSMGVNFYRFSISWPRILPKGLSYEVNQAGIDYYNNLLDALEAAEIEPVVTIFHWDIPYALTYFGGWTSPRIVQYFVDYADLVFTLFGQRVKLWGTLNEPLSFCQAIPTLLKELFFPETPLGTYEYLCGHYALLAHAHVYRLYERKYKKIQNGKLGLVLDIVENLPLTNSSEDLRAAKRAYTFDFDWFANVLVHGDYPQLLKDIVAANSALQNFSTSRLPTFTRKEKILLRGSYDLFLINHYSSYLVTTSPFNIIPSWLNDKQINTTISPNWPLYSIGSAYDPASLRTILNYIEETYGVSEIFITENGYSNSGGLNDTDRITFLKNSLTQLRLAMCEDNIPVTGYSYWSLLDSFEWNSLYSAKMGLVQIDYDDGSLDRTPKLSAAYYKEFIQSRLIDSDV